MRSRRDLVKNSARFVMSLRSARDESDLGRDTDEISPRLARDERYFCETNEISPIWKRFLRDKRDLAKNSGRFVISLRSRGDLAEIKEISPRTLGDFGRSRWDLVEPKALFTWRWGTPGRWGNPLRWGNPPVHIISHFNVITSTC